MKLDKKIIIVTLILLSLFMIGTVSAATDTDIVNSDVTQKQKISHNDNVDKKNTDTITKKKSVNTNKKEEDNNKISSNKKKNDILKANEKTFADLQENITNAAQDAVIKLEDDYIQKDDSEITIGALQRITINGNNHTLNANGKSRIFYLKPGGELTLLNLKLINGKGAQYGGAIYNNASIITTINCTFTNNSLTSDDGNDPWYYGGAIYNSYGLITATNCIFTNNNATCADSAMIEGGAIYNNGNAARVIANNCTFTNNTAKVGGAISNFQGIVTTTQCTFNCNSATLTNGGAGLKITAINCTFTQNTAGSGGALSEGSAINCTFTENFAGEGGAIYNLNATNCTFTNNTASMGGAMCFKYNEYSIINCVLNQNNVYNNNGDGLYLYWKTTTVTIKDCVLIEDNYVLAEDANLIIESSYINVKNDSFTALNALINKGSPLITELELKNNYTYNTTEDSPDLQFINGIPINNNRHIIGNGYTISGADTARIFNVTSGDLTLENLTLTNGKAQSGGAIYADVYSYIKLNNITFQNNNATKEEHGYGGGAIYLELAYISINNTQFKNNTGYYGGALYVSSSSNLTISNSTFNDNTAENGGAIYAYEYSTVIINNSKFNNNKANFGGSMSAWGTANVTNSEFKNNHAQDNGGAILFKNTQNNCVVSSCIFVDNTATQGSAIYEAQTNSLKINNNIFLNADSDTITLEHLEKVNCDYNWFGNTADNHTNRPIAADIKNWLFLNATVDSNIIISLNPSNITFELYKYNLEDNKVSTYDNSQLKPVNLTINSNKGNVNPTIITLGNKITYTPNNYGIAKITAKIENIEYTKEITNAKNTSYTALYQNITQTLESGKNTITLTQNYTYDPDTDQINFINGIPINTNVNIIGNGYTINGNNTARIFYVTSTGNLTIENLTLTNGKAQINIDGAEGGAIYGEENSYINLNNTIFQNNNAPKGDQGYGGAIYTNAYVIINNTQFQNNTGYYGGALYANSTSTVTIINSNFNNNKASYGGAIFTYQGPNVSINNSTFNNNNATKFGGAIGGSAVNVTYSEFKNNHAQNNGGAIYFDNIHDNSIISSCIFVNNTATNSGSAICESFDTMKDNLKINNNIFLNADPNTITLKDSENVNCDDNWFGNTEDNYKTKPIAADIKNWLFLNATVDSSIIIGLDPSNITFELYRYNSEDNKVSTYDNSQLKPVNLTINSNKGNVNPTIITLGNKITYTPNNYGIAKITAKIENIEYTKEITNAKNTSYTALYQNITQTLESGKNTITLTQNYTYDPDTDQINFINGIPINTQVYIIGNGYTINGNNTARIFYITSTGNLTLENLTLTNGKAQEIEKNAYLGGAIYAEANSYISLNNTIFQNNTATSAGGAIYTNAYIIINNTQFNNNTGLSGGAIFANSTSTVTISNTNFNKNNATYSGGAIASNPDSIVTISKSKFNNNTATERGGAINVVSALNVTNSEFKNNHADNNGGAIYIDNTHDNSIISSCIFVNNTATYLGNAIYEINASSLKINNNIFLNSDYNIIHLLEPDFVNLDYNWFGNTADNYTSKPDIEWHSLIHSWLFLNGTADPDTVLVDGLSNIRFKLYLYNGTHIQGYNNTLLYPVNLTISSVKGRVNTGVARLEDKITYTAEEMGNGGVSANIENIKYTIQITNQEDTNITVTNPEITLTTDSTEKIIASLNPTDAGTLSYTSNDTSVAIVDEYGKVTAISKGTALITVYFNGTKYYAAAENKTVLVTVNLKEINTQITSLTIIPTDLFEGKTSNISGTLIVNNTGFANQKITITITNNHGYKEIFTGTTDTDGKFNIKIKPNVNGPVTILTTYNGNKTNKYNYKPTSNSTNRNVQKVLYNIKLDTLQPSYDYNTKVNITGKITSNYEPLDVKNVNITINGVRKTIPLNNKGEFKYTSPYTTEGLYKVLLNCSGTTQNTQYFIKYPTEFIITVSNSTTDKAIKVTITESNGFTGAIKVNIDGKDYTVTLNKGKGTNNNIILTKTGTYTANIQYPGNNTFNATKANSNKFTIKYPTQFTINEIPDTTTDKTITITVTESNRFTGTVNIKIGPQNYKVQLQNGKGKQNIKINTPGTYTANIQYPGNNKYTKTSTNSNKFTIKYPTQFTITKIPNTTTNKAITITVTESNGFTGTVNVKIGPQNYKVQLQNGKGKQNIKINTPGTYTANIKFPENNKYTKTSANSNKFTVKYPTRFTINKIPNIKQGSKIQLTIKEQNKYTGLVNVTLGSEKYTIKLNNGLGKKTVSPKLSPGKYLAKVKFGGNGKYTPANAVSNKFQVTPKAVVKLDTVIVAFKKTFYVEDTTKKYNISLKDVKGKIVKNAQVTLKVRGKTYKTKTNNKGVAIFKLNNLDQKGKYTSLIKYAGDKNYKASNKKVKITVKVLFPTVGKGSKDKNTVKKIQKALKKNGYYLHAGKHYLKIDGIFYVWTEKEVKKYQKNNKLPITGKVDYTTAHKLGII